MRKGIRAIGIGLALGLACQVTGTMDPGDGSHLLQSDSCRRHLHALVAYHRETAGSEGRTLVVEWQHDASVTLRWKDLVQHMWCQHGELHIDFSEPLRDMEVELNVERFCS